MGRKAYPADRLWSLLDKADGHDGCWLFTGSLREGYGQIRVKNRMKRTHRLAWELTKGPIPPGLMVCHHCDVRPCCNPSHLFLGTSRDNMRDMQAKGRAGRHCPTCSCVRFPIQD